MKEETNKQKIQLAKQFPPPLNLPLYGDFPFSEITYLGRTNYLNGLEEKGFVFGIKRKDRKNNILVMGTQGVGKSKLLESMIRQDLDAGFGLILFDFNGGLYENILKNIPQKRRDDICLFNILDENRLPAFNPFSAVEKKMKHIFIEGFLRVLSYYFGEHWNASLEYLWFMILNTMVSLEKKNNFGFVYDFLNDEAYRKEVIGFIREKEVKNFWEEKYEKFFSGFYKELIVPTNSFLQKLFLNKNIKEVFYFDHSFINIEKLVNQNKIILVNLPYYFLGKYTSNFIRDLIILRLKMAGVLRVEKGKGIRDFYIYIDDMESEGEILEDILRFEEYKFSFTISVKNLSQFSPSFLPKIFDSFENFLFFRLSGDDVLRLEKEFFSSTFKIRETLNLNMQEFYAKLVIGGIPSDFFSGETLMIADTMKESLPKEEILEKASPFFIKK